jgi:ATP-dependent helicase HrpB
LACLEAFPDRVIARRKGREWRIAGGAAIQQAQNSAVEKTELGVALEVDERPDQGLPIARLLCAIEPEWLLDLFPERMEESFKCEWNRETERVERRSALLFDGLVIEESRADAAGEQVSALLAEKAVDAGLHRFADVEKAEELMHRLRFAAAQGVAAGLPADLAQAALRRLAEGLRSFSELERAARDGGFEQALLDAAGVASAQLERVAPERIRLPGGRNARVFYREGQAPWVASRLQDFFGMKETPRVAGGRVALVVHLLAPNQRPVQMTHDLAGFWERLYPQVRKELMRRYPRHAWPENPYLPEADERKR